ILRRRPDLLEVLYQPFWWSRQGQELPGEKPFYPQPIFAEHKGRFICRYIRNHIRNGQLFDEVPRLTPKQILAMDMIDAIAADPDVHFEMHFEPGDLQYLNNHVMFHTRTAFEDWPEPERKRHLLRMWLSVPNSRELPESFAPFYREVRPGAVRGGFPGHLKQQLYHTTKSLRPNLDH
ncbi:MAG TPA: TauD/TfdA family dioxygenase, partial [Hyphomicrobiales bacterium]|nr:TauD/TfdA family dioxygenase [Hyphomicrobiales bacterium]